MSLDVYLDNDLGQTLYSFNITHNLNTMADKAGIYEHMWRPEELGFSRAGELVEGLEVGLQQLQTKPDYFKTFNPENGWGTYEGLLKVVTDYLAACKHFPNACLYVSR